MASNESGPATPAAAATVSPVSGAARELGKKASAGNPASTATATGATSATTGLEEQDPAAAAAAAAAEAARRPSDAKSVFSSFSTGLSIDSHDTFTDLNDSDQTLSTVSASSSAFGVEEKLGRTYHKYKAGRYLLPNDEQEQHRLDLQHQIATSLLEGKLHLAPIGDVKRVLDFATGTGIWAVEFAADHPEAQVLGNDLSPIQPKYVPANLKFEIDDVEDEWVHSHRFDYIHGRYICPSLRNVPAVLKRIYDNLEPGGFVEIMETLMVIEAIDDSLKNTSLPRWHRLMLDGVRRMGRDPMCPLRLKEWLAEAGFVGITERKYAVPINPWARGDEQKIRGSLMCTNLMDVSAGFTTLVCSKVWGWTPEQVDEFMVEVKKDLQDRAHHGYTPILVVYAQKPKE